MGRFDSSHSPKSHDLPDVDPLNDTEHEAESIVIQEKGVHLAPTDDGKQPSFNQDSKSSSVSTSVHRSSDSSIISTAPDSRRSSTPGWLQKGGRDMRIFKLRNKIGREQKAAEAKARDERFDKPRSPTFIDFTLPDPDQTTAATTPDKAATPKSPTPQSPTGKDITARCETPSRKPNLKLDLTSPHYFSQPDYTKTPRLELSHLLKVITPGRSPMSRIPEKDLREEPVDYINVQPPAASVSDNTSTSTMSSPGKEKSSWLKRLSIHRRTPSSPPPGKLSPPPLSAENRNEERRKSVHATTRDKPERPQPKRRFWSAPLSRSKESSAPKASRPEHPSHPTGPKLPGLLLVPTMTAPGNARTVHYLPTEARRINTPPVHTASARKGYFMDLKSPSPIAEEPNAYPDGAFHQPFPMPFAYDESDQQRNSITSTSDKEKDWYRVRLDDILYSDDDHEAALQKQELSAIEWNIPEHLPNSPLCPLHPKYGGATRGICVYHGRTSVEVASDREKGS